MAGKTIAFGSGLGLELGIVPLAAGGLHQGPYPNPNPNLNPNPNPNPLWQAELEMMVKSKIKAEIQALSSFGFQYLSQVYLPRKLREGDWI